VQTAQCYRGDGSEVRFEIVEIVASGQWRSRAWLGGNQRQQPDSDHGFGHDGAPDANRYGSADLH